MAHSYTGEEALFRPMTADELPILLCMINARMRWMDEKGICQWNCTHYDEVYPLSYYEAALARGELFVLAHRKTGQIVCAAALKNRDDRWVDPQGTAIYLHHFVSRTDHPGAGSEFLRRAEEYAAGIGKEYFRLDSATDNQALERYYTTRGYVAVGECIDGEYTGILREKKLTGGNQNVS